MILLHPAPAEGASGDAPRKPARNAPIPKETVDRFFDREMSREEREQFFKDLLSDPQTAQKVVKTRQALSNFDEPIFSPDLSASVLSQIQHKRGFLSRPQRRLVTAGRAAVAAALLLAIGAATFIRREHPEVTLQSHAAPLSSVVDQSQVDLSQAWRNVANAAETLINVGEPAAPRAPRAPALGDIRLADMHAEHPTLKWDVTYESADGGTGRTTVRVIALTFDADPLAMPAMGVSRLRIANTSGTVFTPAPVDPLFYFTEDGSPAQWRWTRGIIILPPEDVDRP